ncbi:pyridoxal-phosphate-dependent aminotransferase family protein [Serratia entomophila]|uniref:pyridoxal-phosphate-dependent aminotransferase family protein n=1 Tax=Serratia entomophila TaxID=42906 RepID=UPI00217798FC|nr:aminotransferase class V-fold PLP-dependent enzyme [Serratia entomophila]CAI1163877.1 Soluble hydrogenase 42 kDa subunit [Serratia entomophila]CAI1734876.1 Soluble hydrogenase 42 kDa subunit [Serratia entomophila]CAI1901286.1 Soluble hydrogenase 42 kDa subunit [Serratia entomophila]CAI1907170.1 Soluble hydrogenase 42 kDa subunit [Serratia entomophila]CAI1993785.1 Soluble hydrogenase 42 kDa subunit [Serratia entomophila]
MINNRNTGPTPLPPAVLDAMAQQPLSHRSNVFREAFAAVTAQLARLVNAPDPGLLLSCSGTGGLEASIASTVSAESRVLVLSAGSYGDLLVRIASRFTPTLDIMHFNPGGTFDLAALQKQLMQASYDVVLLTHSESSTGVYHPIALVTATIRAHSDALVLVDVVSSLGAAPIDMVEWGADVLVGATQKALMAPAGMAVVYLSARAQRCVEQHPVCRDYMHLRPWLEASRQHGVPYTPAVNVFQGLAAAVGLIFAEGLPARYQRHQDASARCRAFFADHDRVCCVAAPQHASHSITALHLSDVLSASSIKNRLEYEHHIVVSTGLGPLAERVIRIGHMGHFTLEEIDEALQAIAQVIEKESCGYGD